MPSCIGLIALFLLNAAAQPQRPSSDFDEIYNGYEFFYHDRLNLMVAIHDNHCYYIPYQDIYEGSLIEDGWFNTKPRQGLENYIITTIEEGSSIAVRQSSLEAMRDMFEDLLADYRCADKAVFYLDFSNWHPVADAWLG